MNFMLPFILTFAFCSCATTDTIQTRPNGARVFSGDTEIGVTPLTVSDSEITNDSGNGKLITIRKDGFKELLAWLPVDGRRYSIRFNLSALYRRAKKDREDSIEHQISRSDLYRLTDKLLKFQTELLTGETINTEEFAALLAANPSLGSMHFLEAIRLIKSNGDQEAALQRLNEAVRLAPYEYDFLSLRNETERQ